MTELMKNLIAETMKELLKSRELDKIRVSEICRAANIERSTFYYHFKDKFDLVAWIFYQTTFHTNVINVEEAAESMRKVKSDLLFYQRAYAYTSQNALWQYMHEYFTNEYSEVARQLSGKDVLDPQLAFSIRLYCYGAVGMTKEWVLNDKSTPAEVAVQRMFHSMPECMRQIYFPKDSTSASE